MIIVGTTEGDVVRHDSSQPLPSREDLKLVVGKLYRSIDKFVLYHREQQENRSLPDHINGLDTDWGYIKIDPGDVLIYLGLEKRQTNTGLVDRRYWLAANGEVGYHNLDCYLEKNLQNYFQKP